MLDTIEREDGWRPIDTLSTSGHALAEPPCQKVDMFSVKSNIRWIDCAWSRRDEVWFSQRKDFDEQGRRRTSFIAVVEPSHWRVVPSPPLLTHNDRD